MGPATRNTLRRNTASIMKIWFLIFWNALGQTAKFGIEHCSQKPHSTWSGKIILYCLAVMEKCQLQKINRKTPVVKTQLHFSPKTFSALCSKSYCSWAYLLVISKKHQCYRSVNHLHDQNNPNGGAILNKSTKSTLESLHFFAVHNSPGSGVIMNNQKIAD